MTPSGLYPSSILIRSSVHPLVLDPHLIPPFNLNPSHPNVNPTPPHPPPDCRHPHSNQLICIPKWCLCCIQFKSRYGDESWKTEWRITERRVCTFTCVCMCPLCATSVREHCERICATYSIRITPLALRERINERVLKMKEHFQLRWVWSLVH